MCNARDTRSFLSAERKRGLVTDFPELPPPTDRLGDLTEPERLVVRAFRRWLAGGEQRELLWRTLAYELDAAEARAALQGLEATIRVLSAHAARNIAYHHPCCGMLAPDEAGLLTLVTAVQREQHQVALLVANSFVGKQGMKILLAATDMFASALKRASVELPLRFAYFAEDEIEDDETEVEGSSEPPAPTLH
jgi:hypothetical protein